MPSHNAERAPDPERRMSRRSVLRGAATAGAAGLAATAIGAVASPAFAATSRPSETDRSHGRGQLSSEPIMVHVRDVGSGDIELFAGTSQTRVHDKDLAARIVRALR
jgi:hypothetical protein